ncbi:uncharacterized protein LOC134197530 isoform X2 [Corticium candelabrum]|uniref:uncharacterized protein LOC134197530 isoform X2 n=1 Tax=Corticium candelabrum TaxID=121492 RepID=UPI002E261DCF|nr:uncharacterized protein LOC134197530 isoform X2 [Corticium candelabrum]
MQPNRRFQQPGQYLPLFNYSLGARSTRRGSFRCRRASRKKSRPPKKQLLPSSFLYVSGESSGYGSDAGMSGSGDEVGERSRVATLPPIAPFPTLETRTSTASPLIPATLSPVKLTTPRHSGKSINGQRPSLHSLSTSTASSGDSAVVLDFSAVSSQTSMKSRDRVDGESPSMMTGKTHLELPVMVMRAQKQQHKPGRKPMKLDPLEVSAPTVSPSTPQSNLYLSDTYSNLTKRELYFQFQAPGLSTGLNQRSTMRQPAVSSTLPRRLLPVGHSPLENSVRQQQLPPELQVMSSVIHQPSLPMVSSRVHNQLPSVNLHDSSWQENRRHVHHSNKGRLEILSNHSAIRNPNLHVVGGQQVSLSLDRALGKAPLPSIGASHQLLASSSNLCLCRSVEGSSVGMQVYDTIDQSNDTEATDYCVTHPRLTRRCYGAATVSAESLTPNSSSVDLTHLADGSIPQIYLIAPTPCPPTPLPPNPNYQTDRRL